MRNLARLYSNKIPQDQKQKLMDIAVRFIRQHTRPERIIFFGSVTRDDFDADSDIDVVVIYPNLNSATEARKTLYGSKQPELAHSLDLICVDKVTFEEKSNSGGVYLIAAESGVDGQGDKKPADDLAVGQTKSRLVDVPNLSDNLGACTREVLTC